MTRTPWTPAEDDVVRAHYRRRGGVDAVCARLPHRTRMAVSQRARVLGVLRQGPWTDAEDGVLRLEWHVLSQRELRARLPGRTWTAIRHRAYADLGLPLGVPQGYLAVMPAAVKLGFSHASLLTVLRWAGVAVRRGYQGPKRGTALVRYVDFDAAHAAVLRWLARESIDGAARRHGLAWETVRNWLRDAGVVRDGETAGRGYRLDPAVVDAVVAARRPGARAA